MHAQSHVREAFVDWAENVTLGQAAWHDVATEFEGNEYQVDSLLGRLWNCTDQLPSSPLLLIDMPPSSNGTYAAMVRHLKAEYRNPN